MHHRRAVRAGPDLATRMIRLRRVLVSTRGLGEGLLTVTTAGWPHAKTYFFHGGSGRDFLTVRPTWPHMSKLTHFLLESRMPCSNFSSGPKFAGLDRNQTESFPVHAIKPSFVL
jgi:hypothetical protein